MDSKKTILNLNVKKKVCVFWLQFHETGYLDLMNKKTQPLETKRPLQHKDVILVA